MNKIWKKYRYNKPFIIWFKKSLLCCDKLIRALKQPPPPRQPQKTIGFLSKATALLLRRETCYCDVLWRTWTYDGEFSFPFLNLDKLLKNSTPGKVGYIWQIERVQIEATKVETGTHIQFLATFSLPSLKLPRFPVGNSLYALRMKWERSFFSYNSAATSASISTKKPVKCNKRYNMKSFLE